MSDHLGGLLAFLAGLAVSTLSLGVLPSSSSATVELVAVILANGLSSAIRFLILQTWVFGPGTRQVRPAAG
jgi:hypothetical protein